MSMERRGYLCALTSLLLLLSRIRVWDFSAEVPTGKKRAAVGDFQVPPTPRIVRREAKHTVE